MKKALLLLFVVFITISQSFPQATFNTGAIGVDVNEYGKIELFNAAGIYQMWRTSILVGSSPTAVFDYQNDAENLEPTVLVSNPTSSDFEIYGAFDNSYSSAPPDVSVKLRAFGWNNGGYIVVRFIIKNTATTAINALAGLDIIPYIDEVDGYDTVTYNNVQDVIRIHKGNQTNIGMKLLSSTLTSLYSFEYYDGYYVDADYWTWMNNGAVQSQYASNTGDGSVSITAQSPVALNPGQAFDVFYAMALGANETEMLTNIATAVTKYNGLIVSINENSLSSNTFQLNENFPNPFNRSTTISYQLKDEGFVSLKVFDALGNDVAKLVDSKQSSGVHEVDFFANGLPEGVYYYTLTSENQVKTNKMVLTR